MAKSPKSKAKKKKNADDGPSNFKTGEAIVNLWESSIDDGLADKSKSDDIATKFRAPLIAFVQSLLDGNKLTGIKPQVFKKKDEKNTKRVAKDLGQICAMLTTADEVDLDTFEAAYRLVQHHHHVCKIGGGSGVWCSGGA